MNLRFIWRALKTRYRDNRIELVTLKSFIRPTDIVCDIGANKGSFILWLSKWAKNGKVIAFEPQFILANYLKEIVHFFQLHNVTIEPKAVSSQDGTAWLYVPGGSVSPGASLSTQHAKNDACQVSEVEVVSLDSYFSPETNVRALKIDAEGEELNIFKGATRILKDSQPLLVFECENRHLQKGNVFDVFQFLYEFGYQGEFVTRKGKLDIEFFDPKIHQKQVGPRFWDKKDYVNNFIFYPKST